MQSWEKSVTTVTRENAVIFYGTPVGYVRRGRRSTWWEFWPFDGVDLPADTGRLKREVIDRALQRYRQYRMSTPQ